MTMPYQYDMEYHGARMAAAAAAERYWIERTERMRCDNDTAPSVPCGRCGSETHQVPDCTAKVPDKLTVEGAEKAEAQLHHALFIHNRIVTERDALARKLAALEAHLRRIETLPSVVVTIASVRRVLAEEETGKKCWRPECRGVPGDGRDFPEGHGWGVCAERRKC